MDTKASDLATALVSWNIKSVLEATKKGPRTNPNTLVTTTYMPVITPLILLGETITIALDVPAKGNVTKKLAIVTKTKAIFTLGWNGNSTRLSEAIVIPKIASLKWGAFTFILLIYFKTNGPDKTPAEPANIAIDP